MTAPPVVPECDYHGIKLDRCVRFLDGVCKRCGKAKGAK